MKILAALALDAQNTVSLLVSRGLLDSAVAVSRSFDLSFEPVLGALVDQCVKVASLPRNDSFASLAFERIDCRLPSEGNLLERSWKVLKTYLDTIENLNSDGSMASRRFVVDRLLRYDQGASIPPWLVAPLKAGHYEDLVRLYVRHDRLTEAAQLIIEGIGKVRKSWYSALARL